MSLITKGEPDNKFKAPNGQFYTRQIFYEMNTADVSLVLYTLKDYDIEVEVRLAPEGLTTVRSIPSLSRLYIEAADVSEYDFALKYFGSWKHWKMISDANWFKEYITPMREELATKLMSLSVKRIAQLAEGDTRDAFQANRYLLDKGYIAKVGVKGRPSKEAIQREAEALFKEKDGFNDDFQRLVAHRGPPLGGIVNMDDYRTTK